MSKAVLLMNATLEQLTEIDGIDSTMAQEIITARELSEFIDLNIVYRITGIPKSKLKQVLIEPGVSFLYHKLHTEIHEVKHELNTVKSSLHNVEMKTAEIDNLAAELNDMKVRLTAVEQTQLMASTIQFKDPDLLTEPPTCPEKSSLEASGGFTEPSISQLIKLKNEEAERKFGTKQKYFSTPTSAASCPDFSKLSPILRAPGSELNESYTANPPVHDDSYATAHSNLDLDTTVVAKVPKETSDAVGNGPSAPPESAKSVQNVPKGTQSNHPLHEQVNISPLIAGQGLLASSTDNVAVQPGLTQGKAPAIQTLQGYSRQGILSPSATTNIAMSHGVTSTVSQANHPFWSYAIPTPVSMYQQPASGPNTTAFYPIAGTDSQTTMSRPPQWSVPVVTPGNAIATGSPSNSMTVIQTTASDTPSGHKSRTRKRCQRESSSSSEESLERESSRWKDTTHRDRSRSPQPPKMPIFTGAGNLSWEAFIYQFERTAVRRQWDDAKKMCRFLDCLSEMALEYARRSHLNKYEELRKHMKRRFSKKEEASAARRQLQYVRQLEGETIEEFSERVHFLTMDGYYRSNDEIIDQIGTEAFLRGCQEKEAARIVIEKNPRTINEALKWIKSSLANQKAIYGSRKPFPSRSSFSQRQVTFSDANDSDQSPQRLKASPNRSESVEGSLHSDIKDLVSLVGQLLREGTSPRSQSPEGQRNFYGSSSRNGSGNYGRSPPPRSSNRFRSPQNSRSPSPNRSPRPNREQDNLPFGRNVSPSFQRTSSSYSANTQTLNKKGSDQ